MVITPGQIKAAVGGGILMVGGASALTLALDKRTSDVPGPGKLAVVAAGAFALNEGSKGVHGLIWPAVPGTGKLSTGVRLAAAGVALLGFVVTAQHLTGYQPVR